ncbi:MAG: hypothetical protein LBP53_08115 [Candidatus Peribacteria bacterium]|nr:hypothetical protein [Candidatus Peribacteria bacterium]
MVGITFLATTEKIEALQLGDEHTDFFWKSKEDILQGEFPEWLKEEILAIIDEKII